jgi:hypothetical protein
MYDRLFFEQKFTLNYFDAFISIATSSQRSPVFAVHLHVTAPGVGTILELDAPVITFGTLASHCCVHVGEPSVEPPYIDGRSSIQSFANFVVSVMIGLLGFTL